MMNRRVWHGQRAAVFCLCAALAGCGDDVERPPSTTVSGKVMHNGKPVTEGVVNFLAEGYGAQATLGPDGTFTLTGDEGGGIPLGQYHITIEPPVLQSEPGQAELPPAKEYPEIPQKYRKLDSTDLKAEVTETQNSFEFDLKS